MDAKVQLLADGSVRVVYEVVMQPLIDGGAERGQPRLQAETRSPARSSTWSARRLIARSLIVPPDGSRRDTEEGAGYYNAGVGIDEKARRGHRRLLVPRG